MEAMRGAMELAKDARAEVHLVHIIAPHNTFIPLPLATNAEQSRELAREAAMLQQAEEELKRIKKDEFGDSKKVSTFAAVGQPVEKLVEYARQQEIDLILLATHGRTGAEQFVIGSVTRSWSATRRARSWSSDGEGLRPHRDAATVQSLRHFDLKKFDKALDKAIRHPPTK